MAMSPPVWSPDGTEMAYVVNVPPMNAERHLIVANADGTNPRVVARRKLPQRYLTLTMTYRPDIRPVWLSDGKSIVLQTSDEMAAPGDVQLVRVDVNSGAESVLYEFRGGIAWSDGMGATISPDGRTIFATVPDEAGAAAQVVRIDVATGTRTRLTNDLASYGGATLAGDALLTTRSDTRSSLWVADAAGRGERQVGRDLPSRLDSLTWAGSRVLHVASLAGGFGVWSTDVATGSSQLILPGAGWVSASADGQTLVFQKSAREVWRSDADGSHARILPGIVASLPQVTPDGSRVFVRTSRSGVQAPWVAGIGGGALRQFSTVLDNGLAISRDGRRVMVRSTGAEDPGLYIFGPDGGEPLKKLPPVIMRGEFRWTPDNESLAYITLGTTIMAMPVAGGPPRQLASFARGDLAAFDWSPDGKQLALVREVVTTDIVLVKGVR
jgi:Tol biopolymer transport system component